MKILFFGDSITDATRERGSADAGRVRETYKDMPRAYGSGYVFLAAAQLFYEKPNYYQILNRGIGGDRLPQLYARIRLDVWNEQPDILSILIGVNDVETNSNPNFTELERWSRIYRMMLLDTKEKCPNTKIIICEPFTAHADTKHIIGKYAAEAKKIAEEFDLPFVALQDLIDKAVDTYGLEATLFDGTHPNLIGSKVIAEAWLKVFREQIDNQ
ncbi:MAG: hypothetical protein IJW60_02730 [Clostridia bacterium]|nr:hypothetical protein [Clostridia bacterium]